MSHPATQVPTGSVLTVVGGLMAQIPDPDLTHAGWYVVTLGILSGGYNWWKAWLDSRVRQSEIDELRADLAESRKQVAELKNAQSLITKATIDSGGPS